MNDFRCPTCSKLLFRYKADSKCTIQIKCNRCRTITNLVLDGGSKDGQENDSAAGCN